MRRTFSATSRAGRLRDSTSITTALLLPDSLLHCIFNVSVDLDASTYDSRALCAFHTWRLTFVNLRTFIIWRGFLAKASKDTMAPPRHKRNQSSTSSRASANLHKTEVTINVYDLLPVRSISINALRLAREARRNSSTQQWQPWSIASPNKIPI